MHLADRSFSESRKPAMILRILCRRGTKVTAREIEEQLVIVGFHQPDMLLFVSLSFVHSILGFDGGIVSMPRAGCRTPRSSLLYVSEEQRIL